MKESKTAVSNTAPKPIIPPSCLGEFEWPQVGEFEVAIRGQGQLALTRECSWMIGMDRQLTKLGRLQMRGKVGKKGVE